MSGFMKDRPWTLCQTCVHGQNITSTNGEEFVLCHSTHPARNLTIAVASCSWYKEATHMSKFDAEQIGWVLEIRKGKVVGFRPPDTGGKG